MMEAKLVVSHLQNQVRDLQQVLHYLESREAVKREDYVYVHAKLQEVLKRLNQMKKFSFQRGRAYRLRAQWLN